MKEYLTQDETFDFLTRITNMSDATRIDFRRHCGEDYERAPTDLKLALLYCLPNTECSPVLLQNAYFVACVCGDHEMDGVPCEQLAAELTFKIDVKRLKSINDFSNSRFEPVLASHTGIHGDFYRILGNILYRANANIDCCQLMNDIQNWDNKNDSVKRRWASAYLNRVNKQKGEKNHD